MPTPKGWEQSADPNKKNEYSAILQYKTGKYEINVNVATGQHQIYSIDPFFQTRELLYTLNNNSDITATTAGKTLVKTKRKELQDFIFVGKDAAFKLVKAVGTEEQKKVLANTRAYVNLQKDLPAPESPADPAGNIDPAGPATPNSALEDLSEKFNNKPFKNQNWLRYPEDINSNQDRIIISQINFVAASLEPENVFAGSLQNREGQFAKQKSLGQVILPIPNELSEANSTGWGDDSLSTIAAALMKGGAASFEDFAEGKIFAAAGGLGETLTTATNNPAVGNRVKQFLATKAAAGLLNKGGITINPEAFITRATGSAINPNLELLFQGPKLRQFGFSFKMAPRSQEEARNIRYIIKFFKKGMSPKRSTQSEFSFFLGTPNVFKIQFKSSESSADLRSIGQIKTCALINFTVNYTPDGLYAAYQDFAAGGSQPVAVTMNLAFSELTPIFNDNYEDTDSVGPDNFDDIAFTPPSPAPTDTPTDSPLGQNNNRLPVGTLPPAN